MLDALGGPADLVLSDMAPNTTGHNATDHLRILALVELAADFARKVLAPGGAFVAKVFQGGTERDLLAGAEARLRAGSPRQAAGEPQGQLRRAYVVAQGFRGGRGSLTAASSREGSLQACAGRG